MPSKAPHHVDLWPPRSLPASQKRATHAWTLPLTPHPLRAPLVEPSSPSCPPSLPLGLLIVVRGGRITSAL